MRNRLNGVSVFAFALCGFVAASSAAAAQSRDPSETPPATEDEASFVDTVEVTGSRLASGDPTSTLVVLTKEDIQKRGVTSVEELIRTLPQNVATIGAVTNERQRGPLTNRRAAVSNLGSLGVSAANLGGMGAGNTLILVNGRRLAGAAGIEDGFVNLNGIPLSAVERVEISTGGSSAIYGADAIGGVINFVLKSNYSGTTVSVQHENSSTDADNSRISLYSGYAWGSGSLSGTLDYSERKPINNYKTGYTTENYAAYYNGDTSWDRRSFSRGLQPGVIAQSNYVWDPVTQTGRTIQSGLTLPNGFVGVPTVADFITVGAEALRDYVPELAGPESTSYSGTYNFEQKLSDRLTFFSTGLYSHAKNTQEASLAGGLTVSLAPGQAYNPFPAFAFSAFQPGVSVSYYPGAEIESGAINPGQISNVSESWTVNAGLNYRLNASTKIEAIYTRSVAESEAQGYAFGSIVNFEQSAASPNGVRCANYQLDNNLLTGARRDNLQRVFDRQCAALTSTDPTVAFNPWKSTADGAGGPLSDFYYKYDEQNRTSDLHTFELRLNGVLASLPAGKIDYVIGGEYVVDGVESPEVSVFTAEAVDRDRHAYFAELNVPVFGREFSAPGARTLSFNLAARHDAYTTSGAIGTVGGVLIENGGQIIYGENRFERTTPALGALWEPFDGLMLRARWTQGFKPPPYTQLFDRTGSYSYSQTIIGDPLYQCTTDCTYNWNGTTGYAVPLTTAPNPNLKPQTSEQVTYSANWRPRGALDGLHIGVTYNRTEIDNEYARRSDLSRFLSQTETYRLEDFYPRDASGKITAVRNMVFNTAGSDYESILYEAGYLFSSDRFGQWEPRITVLDNLKAESRLVPTSRPVSMIGKLQGPDDYKVIGSVSWDYRDFTTTLWGYYTPGYENDYVMYEFGGVIQNPTYTKPVGSYTSFDLTSSWRFSDDVRLNFAGRNIFDAKPPFVVVETRPYDTSRWNAAGRTLSLEIQYSF